MQISQSTLQRIQSVTIEDIASDLDIDIRNHKCRCPFHDDHHPSMRFYASSNSAHCFVCGKSWDGIAMVRDMKNLDFTDACRWIADRNNIWIDDDKQHRKPMKATIQRKASPKPLTPKTSNSIDSNYVTGKLSTDNVFCHSLVTCGILSEEQMKRAAQRYRLGTSKDGGVIFWQIDKQQRVRDGKIMYYHDDCHRDHQHDPNWVCSLLSKAGRLPKDYRSVKCLFGLQLVNENENDNENDNDNENYNENDNCIIAIVESEKTAVICSELIPSLPLPVLMRSGSASANTSKRSDQQEYPSPPLNQRSTAEGKVKGEVGRGQVIWLATGGLTCLSVDLLAPLKGYRVMIFPDTDLDGKAFKLWSDKAAEASRTLRHTFPVSNILELHASPDQKARKIDIADFIIEANSDSPNFH